jgi:uncharacterized membrane protein YhaH (DUF805 family)
MTSPNPFGRRGVAMTSTGVNYNPAPPSRPSPRPSPSIAPRGAPAFAPWLRLFFGFSGRVRRRDYWLAQITVTLAMFLGLWVENAVLPAARGHLLALLALLPFSLGLPVAGIWSSLAVQVKRWHDRDKSWPWLFVGFIPFVGGLWLFVELGCLDGTAGENRFGASPKIPLDTVFA